MRASSDAAPSAPSLNPYADFLLRVAERFGVPTVLLCLVVWWVNAEVVKPLMSAHFDVVDKIVAGQERHTEELQLLGSKLDELIRVNRHAPQTQTSPQ